jgi:hypothetical protein
MLNDLELKWKEYISNYKKVELLKDIEIIERNLVEEYNSEFERAHNFYYTSYSNAKDEFLIEQNDLIEKIKVLETLEFHNVLNLDDFLRELMSFQKCKNLDKDKYDISMCSCKHNNLKDLYNTVDLITNEFETFKKKLISIFNIYSKKIKAEDLRKKILENYTSDTEEFRSFRELVANIDYPDFTKNNLEVCIDRLKETINSTEEIINIEVEEEMMPFEELLLRLKTDISTLGLKKISIIELKNKMNELIESYDKEIHMIEIKD